MLSIQYTCTELLVHIEPKNAAKSRIFVHGVPKNAANSRIVVHGVPKNAADSRICVRNTVTDTTHETAFGQISGGE